ncbi:globin domain-containing protein [Pseudonocardia sp. H11422]|uniref:globin domain-containing protein n=1 Tax=Pseudonocardia sp. H11422 TaxID=2835866 RepID=UPI001BDC06D5|nr:globin domain-containing protein [Pseudonocardia sp. H11422]
METLDQTQLDLLRRSRARVENRTDELTARFYQTLFEHAPGLRTLFPLDPNGRRAPLADTLIWLLHRLDQRRELTDRLADLGRDHRKHGLTAAHYEAAGQALLIALEHIHGPSWTPSLAHAWASAYTAAIHEMLAAAAADRGPALWLGRVVEHQRLAADLAGIVVQTLEPLPHHPGQYLSIEIPQRPGLWRFLSPIEPARPDGVLRFHVRALPGGLVSPALVARIRPGDTWRIGPPLGRLPDALSTTRDLLLLGQGTGLAPLNALIAALDTHDDPPRTHLYAAARSKNELRALLTNGPRDRHRPWLTVTPVVPSAGTHRPGSLVGTALRARVWQHHDIVVCGPPRMQAAALDQLHAAGIPAEQLHSDPLPTSLAIRR